MGERWIALARRWVPLHVRDACFEPVLADLLWTRATALGHTRTWRAPFIHLRFLLHLLLVTLQCRRLAAEYDFPRRDPMSSTTLRILLHAFRRLMRQPRFTAAVVVTLALGLGANVTVFSFVDAFLIAPLPLPSAHQLVRVGELRDGEAGITSYPTYRDLRRLTATTLDLAAHVQTEVQLGDGDAAHLGTAELVSGNYFSVAGLTPALGRLLSDRDNLTELAHPVAVISHRYWRQAIGGSPDVVGRRVHVNGASFEIVGVAPDGFDGTFAAHRVDLWVPITMQGWVRPRGLSIERRTWGWLRMFGRLRDDASLADATQSVDGAAAAINHEHPPSSGEADARFVLAPATALAPADARSLTPLLQMAFVFTAVLFLATCANLAGMLQARLASRTRELAIRQSLGGSRLRLAAEWLAEIGLLALLGGGLAFVVGAAGTRALSLMEIPAELSGRMHLSTDVGWRALVYTLGVSLLGAAVVGLATSLRLGSTSPVSTLKAESGTQAGRAGLSRARQITVALQVAFSMVLLVLATLLGSSLLRQAADSPGFDVARIGLMHMHLQRQRVEESQWPELTRVALDQARQTSGVTASAVAMRPPLGPGQDVQQVRIAGYVAPDGRPDVLIDFNIVSADYFRVLGLRFLEGAPWSTDHRDVPAVVINDTMARRFWRDGDALGKALHVGRTPAIVAGVVSDSAYYAVGETPRPMLYLPAERAGDGNFVLLVRTDGDATTTAAAAARSLTATDRRLTPAGVMSLNDLRRVPLFPARVLTAAAWAFGVVSLLLTVVGLYGVIAGSVADRVRELGVRLALGATPGHVQVGVLREALTLTAVGSAIGALASAWAANAMRSWLYTVSPFEPMAYVLVFATLVLISVVSAWPSARAAGRVDPVVVLR